MIKKLGLAAILLAASMANPFTSSAQDASSSNNSSIESEITKYQKYNYVQFTHNPESNIYNEENFQGEIEPIRWLLDLPNRKPIGTQFEILEKKVSDTLTIPAAFSIDGHWYYGVVDESRPDSRVLKINYFDKEKKIATMWFHKDRNTFDIDFKFLEFFHQGDISEYVDLAKLPEDSKFGDRELMIGGSDVGFHYGIDTPIKKGTPITSLINSYLEIGYGETAGYFIKNHFSRNFWEPISMWQRQEFKRYWVASNYHLKRFEEDILDKFEAAGITEEFRERIRDWSSERILRELQSDKKNVTISSNIRIPVNQGEILAESGDTGSINGVHDHFEGGIYLVPNSKEYERYEKEFDLAAKKESKLTNGFLLYNLDPEEFINRYMAKRIDNPETMQAVQTIAEEVREIVQYLQ